jgi:hypothetical protein
MNASHAIRTTVAAFLISAMAISDTLAAEPNESQQENQPGALAESTGDMAPKTADLIEYVLAWYYTQNARNPMFWNEPANPVLDKKYFGERYREFTGGDKQVKIDGIGIASSMDGADVTIKPDGHLDAEITGFEDRAFRIEKGGFGVKNGFVYIQDGTTVVVEKASYTRTKDAWRKDDPKKGSASETPITSESAR